MQEYNSAEVKTLIQTGLEDSLEGMLREGARRMLQAALEMEVATYIDQCKGCVDDQGHRQVVRNGHQHSLYTGEWGRSVGGPATPGA